MDGPSVVSSSSSVSWVIYGNATIGHAFHDCCSLRPYCEDNASMAFKRAACQSLPK
jgi:hypothetical protein